MAQAMRTMCGKPCRCCQVGDEGGRDVLVLERPLLVITLILSGSLTMTIWRWVRGPTVADKAVAFMLMALHLVALLVLTAIRTHTTALFDVVVVLGIATVLSILAITRYMETGRR